MSTQLRVCAGLLFLCAFTPFLPAQQVSLHDALVAARYPLTVSAQTMEGPGEAALQQAIDQSQLVAIGEAHLSREIPLFTAHVCDLMAAHGLDAMAVETSRQAGEFVQSTLGRPDRVEQMAALQRRYPDSVAFASDRQEDDLYEHCYDSAGAGNFQLWGLDQEFVGSAGWLIESMLSTHPGPGATRALRIMLADQKQDLSEAERTGAVSRLYLLSSTDGQIAAARTGIEADGTPKTIQLFQMLATSRDIYLGHGKGRLTSNLARETYMKQSLLRRYVAARTALGLPPRVLLKLGDTHLYSGFNELHFLDLGNFVSELADVSGGSSLHIMILGAAGTVGAYSKFDRPLNHETVVLDKDPDYLWTKPALEARQSQASASPDDWTLYDLRTLRNKRIADLDQDWQRVIYGYDLLVIIPQLTPAELLR